MRFRLRSLVLALALVLSGTQAFAAFSYYKTFTTDATQAGTADSTNYPITISVTDADLKTVGNGGFVQNANGYDIRPYSDSGLTSALTFELVYYNASTGQVEMHVLVGTLSHTTNLVSYLAFGDATISTDGSSNTTWNSNFKGVWHLPNGSTLTANDSTSNGKNGTLVASPTAIAGAIDGGSQFNGTSQAISIATLTIPTTGTLSGWWRPDGNPSSVDGVLFSTRQASSPSQSFDLYPYSDGHIYAGWFNNSNDDRVNWTQSGISQSTFYFLTLTWTNGGTTTLYVNAVSKGTTASLDATWDTSALTAFIAKDSINTVFGKQSSDELRLSNVALSQSWITSEYNNQKASSTFLTWGSKTAVGGGGGATTSPTLPLLGVGPG